MFYDRLLRKIRMIGSVERLYRHKADAVGAAKLFLFDAEQER